MTGIPSKSKFQSTRPIRGATKISSYIKPGEDISIHAPHTGRDNSVLTLKP